MVEIRSVVGSGEHAIGIVWVHQQKGLLLLPRRIVFIPVHAIYSMGEEKEE